MELTSDQIAAAVHHEASALLIEFLPEVGESERETMAMRLASLTVRRLTDGNATQQATL